MHAPQHVCERQGNLQSQFSPSTVGSSGIKFRSSVLVTSYLFSPRLPFIDETAQSVHLPQVKGGQNLVSCRLQQVLEPVRCVRAPMQQSRHPEALEIRFF